MDTTPDTTLLAEIDGVWYLHLAAPAVLAARGESLAYYCAGADWDASPTAQEGARRARIAELEAELARLRAAAPKRIRSSRAAGAAQEAPPEAPAPAPAPTPTPAPTAAPGAITCPLCGRDDFASEHGRNVHISRAHKPPAPAPTPAPPAPALPAPPPAALVASEAWACACGGGFARSLADPAQCIRCTGEYQRARGRREAA